METNIAGRCTLTYEGISNFCRYDYGAAILVLGFVATMLGQMGAHWLMTRLQRRSVIVFCMAALL